MRFRRRARLDPGQVTDVRGRRMGRGGLAVGGGGLGLVGLVVYSGRQYPNVDTVFFTDQVGTGYGSASSQVGPFYCPSDELVYIDLGFFDELQARFGAGGAPFAQAYVIAHEYGHPRPEPGGCPREHRRRHPGPREPGRSHRAPG